MKCYTVSDLAMKFQRGLTCDVVAFETLSDDFGKMVFLQSDRTLNFHAPYGTHYSLRVPKFGRDLLYCADTCDLYVSSSGEEVYRLNLETGQFREPLSLGFSGCNKLSISPSQPQLLGCGGENALCEFWDLRSRSLAARLQVDVDTGVSVTALKFDTDGLSLGVGTSNGNCILFDIRSRMPLYTKEHQYGLPVLDVTFHNSSRKVISTDKKIVKIWERGENDRGKIMTNIETPADINAVHVVEDRRGQSGLLMMAGERSRVMTYFVPQLGAAPRWCSFLENLSEELEEAAGQSVYEDFKFVTRAELEELGASALIGTPMLRGYMHGYFLETKLYAKLRAVSKPFEYEEHRKKQVQDKIEAKRQSRIAPRKRMPKVNKELAEKMLKFKKKGEGEIVDDRFAALFRREEFEIDRGSQDFRLRNPTSSKGRARGDDEDDLDMFREVESDRENRYEEQEAGDDSGDERFVEDDFEEDLPRVRAETAPRKRPGKKGSDGEEEDGQILGASKKKKEKEKEKSQVAKGAAPKMYELSEGVSAGSAAFAHSKEEKLRRLKSKALAELPLAERAGAAGAAVKARAGSTREMSYVPSDEKKAEGLQLNGKDRRLVDGDEPINRSKKPSKGGRK